MLENGYKSRLPCPSIDLKLFWAIGQNFLGQDQNFLDMDEKQVLGQFIFGPVQNHLDQTKLFWTYRRTGLFSVCHGVTSLIFLTSCVTSTQLHKWPSTNNVNIFQGVGERGPIKVNQEFSFFGFVQFQVC